MARLSNFGEVLMVTGPDRRLVVTKELDLLADNAPKDRFRFRNIEVVDSCHHFAVHEYDKDHVDGKADSVYVCAANDCRVSILARVSGTGEYQMR